MIQLRMYIDMSKNIIYKINPFIKLLVLFLMILTVFVSKSLYSLIIIGIVITLVVISSEISVKKYIDDLKKIILWLIFILLAYIIILDEINTILFLYKILLCFIALDTYITTSSFNDIDSALNTFLSPLKIIVCNIDQISFNITLSIFFIINLIKEDYNSMKYDRFLYSFSPKYIIARIIYTNNKLIRFKNSLLLKYYKAKKYSINKCDFVLLITFIFLFIIVVCKEVF